MKLVLAALFVLSAAAFAESSDTTVICSESYMPAAGYLIKYPSRYWHCKYRCTINYMETAVCESMSREPSCRSITQQHASWERMGGHYVTVFEGWNRISCPLPKTSPFYYTLRPL